MHIFVILVLSQVEVHNLLITTVMCLYGAMRQSWVYTAISKHCVLLCLFACVHVCVCVSLFVNIISEGRHSVEFLCFFIRVKQLIWKPRGFLGRNKMKPRRSFSSWDVTHICRRRVSDELSVHSRPNSHFCYHSIATQDCVILVTLWHPFYHLITSDMLRVI